MNRRLLIALAGGSGLLAITGVLMATAQTEGQVFIPGGKPVTEDQVREKLTTDGFSNVQVVRQGRFLEALGTKDGKTNKVLVNAQTGRLAAGDDDDDDD